MDNFITSEESEFKRIFNRIRAKNFSGNTGQAIKNSGYQLATNIIIKIGSLLFTIIIARMLMPERMGLYSLALSTIVFFSAFSDFGIMTAIITFISKMLGNDSPEKAKGYFNKLIKWKIYFLTICSLVLIASAYFIANNYYNKPIFYALLAGGLYIPVVGFLSFFEQLFKANNNFKMPLVKEITFQSLRLTIIPLSIFLLIKSDISNGSIIAGVLFALISCYLITFIILLLSSKKRLPFLKVKASELNEGEVRDLRKFLIPLSVTALSGMFFGYVDTIMLGHFVSGEYIGYYGAAFALLGSATAIIGFVSTAVFPIFSKLDKLSLEKLFKKSLRAIIVISFLSAIVTYFFAYYVVRIAYGPDYLVSVSILKYLAILVFILPISGIYDAYLLSQKKTKMVAFLLIVSTILNIILNFIAINYGLRFSEFHAILGACFASIISRVFYFVGDIFFKHFRNNIFVSKYF